MKTAKPVPTTMRSAEPVPQRYAAMPEPEARTHGYWSEAYADYEKHGNLVPGSGQNVTRETTTIGTLSGIDRRIAHSGHGDGSVLVGLMGGSHKSHSNFTDTSTNTLVSTPTTTLGGDPDVPVNVLHQIDATSQEQSQTGVLLGAYTSG